MWLQCHCAKKAENNCQEMSNILVYDIVISINLQQKSYH